MRGRLAMVAVAGLALVAACGGGGQDERAEPATVETAAEAGQPASPDSSAGPQLKRVGYLRTFDEAGFTVFWPSGCGGLREQISSGATRRAQQEFIYTCDRDGEMTVGASVRVYHGAHGNDGAAPGPDLVTELVKRQLQKSGTRILRQRPLKADDIEGVDVHAAEAEGAAEVWLRGLLADGDVYMIMAWDKRGGLFENPEIVDFFASFRIADD